MWPRFLFSIIFIFHFYSAKAPVCNGPPDGVLTTPEIEVVAVDMVDGGKSDFGKLRRSKRKKSKDKSSEVGCFLSTFFSTLAYQDNTALDPVRYKTKLCKNWQQQEKCPYGPRCLFAHGTKEMRTYSVNSSAINTACNSSCVLLLVWLLPSLHSNFAGLLSASFMHWGTSPTSCQSHSTTRTRRKQCNPRSPKKPSNRRPKLRPQQVNILTPRTLLLRPLMCWNHAQHSSLNIKHKNAAQCGSWKYLFSPEISVVFFFGFLSRPGGNLYLWTSVQQFKLLPVENFKYHNHVNNIVYDVQSFVLTSDLLILKPKEIPCRKLG